eukprot:c21619_g1_i1 orf=443-1615(-)
MGNSPSRRRRNESPMYPPQQIHSLPPGPVAFTSLPPYHPTRFPPPYYSNYHGSVAPPHFYPVGAYSGGHQDYALPSSTSSSHWAQSSGSVLPSSTSSSHWAQSSGSVLPSSTSSSHWAQSSDSVPPVESSLPAQAQPLTQQQTVTIRNAVNIQKNTVSLIEDAEAPGFYLLAFSYDADSAGSFSIFLFAKEDDKDGSIKPWNPKAYSPVRIPFEKGVGQKFQQASGTGIYLDGFDSALLEKEWPVEGCPLVIRAQSNAKDYQQDSASTTEEDIGAALPKFVNSQVTQAVITKKDTGECKVRVLRQIIWVDGVRYELKELYGVENMVDRNEYNEEDFGKECVICMSEPRDTAVMPCRHMCMCNGCASCFKSQMNRCPICRQPVETFLKINV